MQGFVHLYRDKKTILVARNRDRGGA